MANTPPQFSPAQILEAGQRAEADGRLDHAIQFYQHIAQHYANQPEAELARDGLGRLGFSSANPRSEFVSQRREHARDSNQPVSNAGLAAMGDPTETRFPNDANSHADNRNASRLYMNGAHRSEPPRSAFSGSDVPRPAPPSLRSLDQPTQRAKPNLEVPVNRMQLAPAGYDPGETVIEDDILPLRRGYGFGRFLAAIMTFFGIVFIMAGFGLVMALFAVPVFRERILATELSILAAVTAGPFLLCLIGFSLCLFGQVARATFDSADAAHRQVTEMALALRLGSRG
jgi:hypothetical protein